MHLCASGERWEAWRLVTYKILCTCLEGAREKKDHRLDKENATTMLMLQSSWNSLDFHNQMWHVILNSHSPLALCRSPCTSYTCYARRSTTAKASHLTPPRQLDSRSPFWLTQLFLSMLGAAITLHRSTNPLTTTQAMPFLLPTWVATDRNTRQP